MRTKLRAILTLLLLFIPLTACQQKEDPAPAEGTTQTEALNDENQAEALDRLAKTWTPA